MAGLWRLPIGVMILGAMAPFAHAFGGCWHTPSVAYSYAWPIVPYAYYYGPSVKVVPLVSSCETVPPPPVPRTSEPPLRKQSALKAPLIEAAPSSSTLDRCSVSFWNLTGRDVTLTIAGRSHELPRNRKVMLEVEREFRWQIGDGSAHLERVPDGQATHDVAVRE